MAGWWSFCSTTVGRHTVSREWCRSSVHRDVQIRWPLPRQDRQDRIEEMLNFPVRNPWQCSVELTGQPGRPPFLVPMDYIEALIEFAFTYEQMSAVLGISSQTWRRRRQEHGLPVGRNYTDIPDSELDQEINSIFNGMFTYLDMAIWSRSNPNHGWSVKQWANKHTTPISIHPLWMSINYVRGYCFRNSDVCGGGGGITPH